MHRFHLIAVAVTALGVLHAQGIERHATMGRGPEGRDGCALTVIVDGAANIEVRGDHAMMRDVSGRPPEFRNFECSRPIPPNAEVRYTAVSGRGRQEMIRSGRDGGPVVVHIEDPQGGAGEYRFVLAWGERREQGAYDRDRDHEAERRDGDYWQDRDRFFQGEEWRRNLFQRVRQDVEHLEHSTIPFTGDRMRLSHTIVELSELQGKLSEGRYDERQLDDVMGALRGVVEENRLSPRDRDMLADDLRRLREFRERHDEYGARHPNN